MDQHLHRISAAALQRLEPALADDERVAELTFLPGDVCAEGSVRAERKGTGFMKRGAPEPGTPVHFLSITGIVAPGTIGATSVGYLLDINDPASGPSLELLSTWDADDDQMNPVDVSLDQLAPFVLQLLSAPTKS